MLAAIVSEASKNLSGKIFLGAWFATLAISGITFSISYLKASDWLNRGKEIGESRNALNRGKETGESRNILNLGEIGERRNGQAQTSCVQRHFQGMLPDVPNPNPSGVANAEESLGSLPSSVPNPSSNAAANTEESLETLRRKAIAQRQEINTRKLELITQRNTLQASTPSQSNNSATPSLSQAELAKLPDAAELVQKAKLAALAAVEGNIKTEDRNLAELDNIQRELGIPKISMGEVTQLSEQDQAIQDRIYVHYDIARTFYATHQAGSVGASLALLFGSIVLIFITSDIWEGKIKNNPGLVFPLILFGSTYILFLNLPTVLSAEEIYQANLAQYVGYINLEEEICTVLATERFVGDSDQPGTIQKIEFNRLVHSVEQRMRELNTRTITSNVGAIDSLRFDLDALSYPRKK
ncbi:hypothetical protein H6F75_20050 [Nodosilinea sp. FACHB-131]|uniref:hypothetical protein n=1 Tax=Cyanophyceae TaxID=3028117 RepID=UPI001681DEC5|nr:hypothetical protein [Nodosilinea sp. FACHB-131]MBD1875780.1 hypothetical protein [Nodosilinea sp. FACHB-131]